MDDEEERCSCYGGDGGDEKEMNDLDVSKGRVNEHGQALLGDEEEEEEESECYYFPSRGSEEADNHSIYKDEEEDSAVGCPPDLSSHLYEEEVEYLRKEKELETDDGESEGGVEGDEARELMKLRRKSTRLKQKLENLVQLREELLGRRKRLEQEREREQFDKVKDKLKRLSMSSIFGDNDEDEDEKSKSVTLNSPDNTYNNNFFNSNHNNNNNNNNGNSNNNDNNGNNDNDTNGSKKNNRAESYVNNQSTTPGRPLRSLGLMYQCGQRAIGVARAGYNSLFRIHLPSAERGGQEVNALHTRRKNYFVADTFERNLSRISPFFWMEKLIILPKNNRIIEG